MTTSYNGLLVKTHQMTDDYLITEKITFYNNYWMNASSLSVSVENMSPFMKKQYMQLGQNHSFEESEKNDTLNVLLVRINPL